MLTSSIKSGEHFANGLAILQFALKNSKLHVLLRDNTNNTHTRLQRLLDEAVTQVKSFHVTRLRGARLAQAIIRLGLVDEYRFFVYPTVSKGMAWFGSSRG